MKELTPQETFQAILDGKKVEYRHPHLDWTILKPNSFKLSKLLAPDYQFRLVQEMVTVGDVSFPKPESESEKFKEGQEYFMPDLCVPRLYHNSTWEDDHADKRRLNLNIIHLSKENAIAHAKVLIKLSGGTIDE